MPRSGGGGGGTRSGVRAARGHHVHRGRGGGFTRFEPVFVGPDYVVEDVIDEDEDDDTELIDQRRRRQQSQGDVLDFLDPFGLHNLFFNPLSPGWGVVMVAGVVGLGIGFVAGYFIGEGSVGSGIGRAAGRTAEKYATRAGSNILTKMLER